MKLFRGFQARPWPATAVVAGILVVVSLFVPVSYQKTVGQDVTLTLARPGLDVGQLQKIASELKAALHAENFSFNQEASGAVVTVQVPGRSALQVSRVAQAFAQGLTGRGIATTAQVTPRIKRVLGNVYAYAMDNIINIHVDSDGKTPAQVEAEIRGQLEAAGIENPSVEYRKEGGQTTLLIGMEKSAMSGDSASCPQVNVTVDGQEPCTPGEKRAEIRVKRTPGMSDQDMISEVQRQLREQGVDAEVTINNGRVEVHRRNP